VTGLSLNRPADLVRLYSEATQALERAQALERQALRIKSKYMNQYELRRPVSAALWCDQGNHAFSGNDEGRSEYTRRAFDVDGDPITKTFTVCGPCDRKQPPFQALPPAVQDAVPGVVAE